MAIVKWTSVKDMYAVHDRFSKTIEDSSKQINGEWSPLVDIIESEQDILISLEVPGVSEENIDVQINDNVLLISGNKPFPLEKSTETYYRLERCYGRFVRSFALPQSIDQAKIKASLKDGVLKIILNKLESTTPKSIKVEKE